MKERTGRFDRLDLLLMIAAVALFIFPFIVAAGSSFAGADELAEEIIQAINPDYQPWVSTLWEPPSGEIESLLFALQAAIGAAFIGYFWGYRRGQASRE